MGLTVMPGERLELQVRVPPSAIPGRYAAVLAYPTVAAALWSIFRSAWWQGRAEGAWYQVWRHAYGTPAAADAWAMAALFAAGTVWAFAAGRRGPLWVGAVSAVAAVAASYAWRAGPFGHETRLALCVAALAAPALVAVDLDRRLRTVWLTNLRVASGAGLFGRERSVLHDQVRDLEVRQGILQRLTGAGSLVFTLAGGTSAAAGQGRRDAQGPAEDDTPGAAAPDGAVAIGPVHPVAKLQALAQLLIRDATGTDFLRRAEDLARRKQDAKAALHGELRASER